MRRFLLMSAVVLALTVAANAQQISGNYVETRSADVYTGSCVANGEVGLTGDQAILAWQVKNGSWNNVALDGLSVVGIVKASATLGDVYSNPLPAKSILIVDQKATAAQRDALISFAHAMGGDLLKDVVGVQVAPIQVEISHADGHYSKAVVKAGNLAGIETRALSKKDHLCGNEETFYPPLTAMAHAMPAVAELDQYNGPGLGVVWTLHGKRSAFVGSFAR